VLKPQEHARTSLGPLEKKKKFVKNASRGRISHLLALFAHRLRLIFKQIRSQNIIILSEKQSKPHRSVSAPYYSIIEMFESKNSLGKHKVSRLGSKNRLQARDKKGHNTQPLFLLFQSVDSKRFYKYFEDLGTPPCSHATPQRCCHVTPKRCW
jgi:hypothetical protein